MAEKLVPLSRDGVEQGIAVSPPDFFKRPLVRKDGAPGDGTRPEHFETYADAGYQLSDYYEDRTPYEGPKSKRQHAARERKAQEERAAASADEKAPSKAEARKG